MSRSKYLFASLNLSFIIGIIFYNVFVGSNLLLLALFIVFFTFSFIPKSDIICSVSLHLSLFLLGSLYKNHWNYIYRDSFLLDNVDRYVCIAQKTLKLDRKFNSLECLVVKIKRDNRWVDVSNILKVQLIIRLENPTDNVIFYGDIFLVKSRPNRLEENIFNDKSLSFCKYNMLNGIFYNNFLSFDKMEFLGNSPLSSFRNFFEKIRFYLKNVTFSRLTSVHSRSILSNLLFGKGDPIENNLKNAYAKTGISHILAISGLHIGLIFWLISILLSLLRIKRSIIDIVSIIVIWFYGFVVLMPASVFRAILMISFYKISNLFDRKSPKYTFVFNSFIFSLVINPMCIYSIGFQLSYLATFGILFLNQIIYNFLMKFLTHQEMSNINIKFDPVRFVLSSISVFISVMVFTMPVIIHNFGYFNFLSFAVNILLSPLFSIILFCCVLMILISVFHVFISFFVEKAITFLNFCILEISNFDILIITSNSTLNIFKVYFVVFLLIYLIL